MGTPCWNEDTVTLILLERVWFNAFGFQDVQQLGRHIQLMRINGVGEVTVMFQNLSDCICVIATENVPQGPARCHDVYSVCHIHMQTSTAVVVIVMLTRSCSVDLRTYICICYQSSSCFQESMYTLPMSGLQSYSNGYMAARFSGPSS